MSFGPATQILSALDRGAFLDHGHLNMPHPRHVDVEAEPVGRLVGRLTLRLEGKRRADGYGDDESPEAHGYAAETVGQYGDEQGIDREPQRRQVMMRPMSASATVR